MRTPPPCSPTDHACTPPGAGPAVEAVRSSFFSTGMFLHAVHRVHASGRPPHPPGWAALAPPGAPWLPPPSPPHRPHPTGQVLSLLEIKVHSLWCRGAAATASCFVSGVWLGRGVAVTQWGPPICSPPPPCVGARSPAGSSWPGLSPHPRAALQMSVLSQEPRAVNYMVINL